MSESGKKQAVILGVGPSDGLGAALARRFARGGIEVTVASRNLEKLQGVADEINAAGGVARAMSADVTKPDEVIALLNAVAEHGPVAAVLFNAGNNQVIPFEELTAETFTRFWEVGCLGGFHTAKAALPIFQRQGYGSLIFTGASGSMRGRPNFAHFAASKAGLRMLAQSLARTYWPQNVHVAHVVVDGVIDGDRIRNYAPQYLEKLGEDGSLKPDLMAENFWMLHNQPRAVWTFEMDLRPFKENW